MNISVSDIPDEVVKKLDKIAIKQNRSRNQQIINILTNFVEASA